MYTTLGLLQAVGIGVAAIVVVIVAIFIVSVILSAIKIVKEYERGVIFRLGRVQGGPKGPGLFILLPLVDRMVKIDLRTVTMDVPPQDVITRDNVPARVNAVIYFRVVDPNKSVIEVENHVLATSQISQTTLRSVLGPLRPDHSRSGSSTACDRSRPPAARPVVHPAPSAYAPGAVASPAAGTRWPRSPHRAPAPPGATAPRRARRRRRRVLRHRAARDR